MTEIVEAPPRHPVLSFVRRIPATLTIIAVLLAVGVVFAGLWRPFEDSPLWDTVAYGLPALLEGRWWTPITGTFFVNHPLSLFTSSHLLVMAYRLIARRARFVARSSLRSCSASLRSLAISLLPPPPAVPPAVRSWCGGVVGRGPSALDGVHRAGSCVLVAV